MSNVPAGAVILLDFIGQAETGKTNADAYLTIYGHKQGRLPKPLTSYTLDELAEAQKAWSKNFGSSAAGKYQIIRKTLVGLVARLGLPGSTLFTPEVQDTLGYELLKGRGYERFLSGTLPLKAFGNELAKEWASFPVLTDMQGQHRALVRGQSHYAGDGVNKALVKPGDVEAVLSEILNRASVQKPAPEPASPVQPSNPTPEPETPASEPRKGLPLGWIIAGVILAVIAAAFFIPAF